jgi:hypothetical protein
MHIKSVLPGFLAACTASLMAFLPLVANSSVEQEWRFRVYLDDREIGHHHFSLTRDGEQERLATEADFKVTLLKIPVFRYRHDNVERWNGECLQQITSSTDQNGTVYRVQGQATDKGFQVTTKSGEQQLPACISTFAYWDRGFLQRERLLNSQTGEYLDVDVAYLGEKPLPEDGDTRQGHHYRLTAKQLDIEVWYSDDDQWLALQSTTESGRLLRYVAE